MPAAEIYFRITNRAARRDVPEDGALAYAARPRRRAAAETMSEFVVAGLSIALVTAISFALEPFTGYESIALLYLLTVVALGLRMRSGTVLTVAAASALLWNFVFIPPRLTFYIDKVEDGMMFAMFFVVAVAMGHLTTRLRRTELAERRRERRTAALYELAHQAAFATDLDTGLGAAVQLIESIFAAPAALYLRTQDHALSPAPHPASSLVLSPPELREAALAFAGGADSAGNAGAKSVLHIPLQGRTATMGVLSLRVSAGALDPDEKELLAAFALLIGLTLEKDHVVEALKRAEILEASERFGRTLLDSVSHELKTPLAAVQAGLDGLERQIGGDKPAATLAEMRAAVRRLRRVIDNLLDMTRIEAGVIEPKLDWCDVGDLVGEAIALAGDALAAHDVEVEGMEGLPMVKLDQPLIEQALSNILLNAAAWSGAGKKITIRAGVSEGRLLLSVLDEGPGLRNGDLRRVFEKFYRAPGARTGGTGLGLSIVEGFVRAHGGSVRAANRPGGGAEFALEIPVETMRAELGELA